MNPSWVFFWQLIGFLVAIAVTIGAAFVVADLIGWIKVARLKVGAFIPQFWPEKNFWQLHKRLYPHQTQFYVAVNRQAKRFVRLGGAQ